jgi:hypothetical protein
MCLPKDTIYQMLRKLVSVVFKEIFRAWNKYVRKEERQAWVNYHPTKEVRKSGNTYLRRLQG